MADVFAENSYVFVPSDVDQFVPAKALSTFKKGEKGQVELLDAFGENAKKRTMKDKAAAKKRTQTKQLSASESSGALPMDAQSLESMENMVSLKQLNNASILHNLRLRYSEDDIYTSIGTILVSINPFKMLPIYTPRVVDSYIESGAQHNPPHVYGIADDAYRQMTRFQSNQSCIVAGESGSGKTEATKLFLQYVAEISSRGDNAGATSTIQQQILEANPLMEAFGNAKTTRNDNSSRFGKWIAVTFDNKRGTIINGSITQYLLEKSRVVRVGPGERNYHVFYQLCAASRNDAEFGRKYSVQGDPDLYWYLNQPADSTNDTSSAQAAPTVNVSSGAIDDSKEWRNTQTAMDVIGMSESEIEDVLKTASAVLNLGNVQFSQKGEVSSVVEGDALGRVVDMLGSDAASLTKALTKRNVSAGKDVVFADNNASQAADARDALSKALYSKLFVWLTERINATLASSTKLADVDKSIIGILDIFGFESFFKNSFEQLCINYCNEVLQSYFNTHIFTLEQSAYKEEGIDVSKIEFVNNEAVLKGIEGKKTGILACIDEECKLPRGSDEGALAKVLKNATEVVKKPDVAETRKTPHLQAAFVVVHYAGEVAYNVEEFLVKNKDTLPNDLKEIATKSKRKFVSELLDVGDASAGDTGRRTQAGGNKKTIGSQFSAQLQSLMKTLNNTEPHFVRCIKPNSEKTGDVFTGGMVLDQLKYSGLLEVCRIRQLGYPIRKGFDEFVSRYSPLSKSNETDPRALAAALPKLMPANEWQIGKTKVFMRTDVFNNLENERENVLGEQATTIQRLARMFVEKQRYGRLDAILKALKDAASKRDMDALQEAFYKVNDLPHSGRHLDVVIEARKVLEALKEEVRAIELLERAIASKDEAAVDAAIKNAKKLKLGKHKTVAEGETLLKNIKQQKSEIALLEKAIDARELKAVESAIASASKVLPSSDATLAQAKELQTRLKEEEKLISDLKAAVSKKNVNKIVELSERLVNEFGRRNHPLIKEGEKVAKKVAAVNAKRQKEITALTQALRKAAKAKNLKKLNELHAEVVKFGVDNEVVKEAMLVRSSLMAESDKLAGLKSEIELFRSAMRSEKGVTSDALTQLNSALEAASKTFGADNEHVKIANDLAANGAKQLGAQANLRDALKKGTYDALKKAGDMASAIGMENQLAQQVYEELRAAEKQRRHRASLNPQAAVKLKDAPSTERAKDEAKRKQKMAGSSKKGAERIKKAESEAYQFFKYYDIRTNEDFTQFDAPPAKRKRAERKLLWQKNPLSKSILNFEGTQNRIAIRNFRSVLAWCGDVKAQFPATLAHDVLVMGLHNPGLVDEIYIQIIKQTRDNPRSTDRAWMLMALVTKTYPPSEDFWPYVMNYLIASGDLGGMPGNLARVSLAQINATLDVGPSPFTPQLDDVQIFESRPPVFARVSTSDGKSFEFMLAPHETVGDLMASCAAKVSGVDATKYAIFVEAEESAPPEGESAEITGQGEKTSVFAPLVAAMSFFDNAAKILKGEAASNVPPPAPKTPWPLPGVVFVGDVVANLSKQKREPVFTYKQAIWFSSDKDSLTFHQLSEDMKTGALALNDGKSVARLAALAHAAKNGGAVEAAASDGKALLAAGFMNSMAGPWYESLPEIDWANAALEALKSEFKDEKSPKACQDRFVAEAKKSELFGSNLFYCYRADSKAEFTIAIDTKGLSFISDQNKIVSKIPFNTIARFGASPTFLWLHVAEIGKKNPDGSPLLVLVTLMSMQSAELYDLIYRITHYKAGGGGRIASMKKRISGRK